METVAIAPAPAYRLYPSTSVMGASFIGSPLAGIHLMARNYKRLGKVRAARTLWVVGTFCHLLFLTGWVFAESRAYLPANLILPVSVLVAGLMSMVATKFQGESIKAHRSAGGKLARGGWVAIAWAIVLAVVIFGIPWAIASYSQPAAQLPANREDVKKDTMTMVVFYDGVDRSAARRCGEALIEAGFVPPNSEAAIILARTQRGTCLTFPVIDGFWNRPGILDEFRKLTSPCRALLGDSRLTVRLTDTALTEKASFVIE